MLISFCSVVLVAVAGAQGLDSLDVPTTAQAFASSADGRLKLSSIAGPVKGTINTSDSAVDFTLDDTPSGYKQAINGFGAAISDATVISIGNLTSTLQAQLLNQLMTLSGSDGAGLNMMRHTIGSSDLSPEVYSYDDSDTPDTALSEFNLGSRGTAMASLLARMKAINPGLFIVGSSWSPPGWMKVNRQIDMNRTKDNRLSDQFYDENEPDYSEPFAQYLVKYLQAFQTQSANVDAISIQNEPLNNQEGYPTMNMTGLEAAALIKNSIGPALSAAGLNTAIWGHDDNTGPEGYINDAQIYLNCTSSLVNTIAWHCYYVHNTGWIDWSVLSTFYRNNIRQFPRLQMYMSECGTPPPDNGGHWFGAANWTIGPLQNWAGGSMAWTLSTFIKPNENGNTTYGPHLSTGGCDNCRGLVTVFNQTYYELNVAYYCLAHFSRFMPRGARVLDGQGSDGAKGVQFVGTLNPDGTRSVVILNTMTAGIDVNLKTESGEVWYGTVPEQSIVTWVLPKVR